MNDIVNDEDLETLKAKDAIFGMISERYGNPPGWKRTQGFESLCRIILEQQVSLSSAKAHFDKLDAYLDEFSPRAILRLSDEEMRSCQISRQKSAYLRALAAALEEKRTSLEEIAVYPEQKARDELMKVKGIGPWTADIYLMFCLQKKDIFPAGDIAVKKTVVELTGARTEAEIAALSEAWRPLRSLAAYCFWHYYLSKRNRG
jgi:DNA-3-methyladenine glycosylase II